MNILGRKLTFISSLFSATTFKVCAAISTETYRGKRLSSILLDFLFNFASVTQANLCFFFIFFFNFASVTQANLCFFFIFFFNFASVTRVNLYFFFTFSLLLFQGQRLVADKGRQPSFFSVEREDQISVSMLKIKKNWGVLILSVTVETSDSLRRIFVFVIDITYTAESTSSSILGGELVVELVVEFCKIKT